MIWFVNIYNIYLQYLNTLDVCNEIIVATIHPFRGDHNHDSGNDDESWRLLDGDDCKKRNHITLDKLFLKCHSWMKHKLQTACIPTQYRYGQQTRTSFLSHRKWIIRFVSRTLRHFTGNHYPSFIVVIPSILCSFINILEWPYFPHQKHASSGIFLLLEASLMVEAASQVSITPRNSWDDPPWRLMQELYSNKQFWDWRTGELEDVLFSRGGHGHGYHYQYQTWDWNNKAPTPFMLAACPMLSPITRNIPGNYKRHQSHKKWTLS